MGHKSGGAAAPDPRLVEAQIRSMGIQDASIEKILANSNDLLPLQKQELQQGIDTSKTAYDQSQEDRQWMLTRRAMLGGVQDKMVADATKFNLPDKENELAGQAVSDVNQAFSGARGQSARDIARLGINPNSGRAAALDAQTTVQQALAGAAGATGARRQARTEGYALTDRAQNALAGYPAMSAGATAAGAGYGANGISIANTGLGGMNSGFGSAAQVAAQLGTNATGMWVQQANYKLGADQNKTDLGGIGALMGGAAKLGILGSDPAYKVNIVREGDHPTLGIGVYSFEYRPEYVSKWGRGRHLGVMADDLLVVMPTAVKVDHDGDTVVDYSMIGALQ